MMDMRLILSVLAVAALGACSSTTDVVRQTHTLPSYDAATQNPFIASGRSAMDEMVRGLDMGQLGQAPLLVATVVNVNDLSRSAPLGRTLSEIYASQLANKGFNVKELKLRGDVYVKEGAGELLLSRQIRDIAQNHSAGLVLVGTYSQAAQYTYVSLKLVRTADSRIVRSHDYALPNDRDVQRLLASGV